MLKSTMVLGGQECTRHPSTAGDAISEDRRVLGKGVWKGNLIRWYRACTAEHVMVSELWSV